MTNHDLAHDPGDHSSAAGAPGASGPGEAGYEGEATIGDEGAAAGPGAFVNPNDTEGPTVEAAAKALEKRLRQEPDDDID